MKPTFFDGPEGLRAWLAENHASASELWIGFHKKGSGKGGITYPQALDEALCMGWIDAVRKNISADDWMIRFTPRQAKSHWSKVNIRRAAELIAEGRMKPRGLEVYRSRTEERSGRYAYENMPKALSRKYQQKLRANAKAWSWFAEQAPYYRKVCTYWVMTAKKEETRERRLASLIACSAKGSRVPQLIPPGKKP